jgi:hypothetical protein
MPRITHSALSSNAPKTASIGPPSAARTPNIEPPQSKISKENAA